MSTYRVTASVPAPRAVGWDGASGEWSTITIPKCQPAQDEKKPAEPTLWWMSAGVIAGLGVALAVAAGLLGTVYWLSAAMTGHPAPGRSLLVAGVAVLATLAGVAVIAGWTVRVMDNRQSQATTETAAAMRAETDGLRTELGRVAALLEQSSVRFGAALGAAARVQQVVERLAAAQEMVVREVADLHRRVEAVEAAVPGREAALAERFGVVAELLVERINGIEERQVDPAVLRGIAAWAAQLDHRLAELQRTVHPDRGPVPDRSNGHTGESPMELSDEALRGYFLGFYDRERDHGETSTS